MKKGCLIALAVVGVLGILGVIVVMVLGYVGYKAVKSPEFQEGFNESFKTSFKESFVEKCAEGGFPDANQICSCMADYMVTNYTVTELTGLATKTPEEIQNSDMMTKSAEACVTVGQ